MIRTATNDDCPGIIDLVDRVYREYGELMCLEDADRDLADIETHYVRRGGQFWVLELDGRIMGSHGALPNVEPAVCRFRRLYLDQSLRGTHWGHDLMQITIDWGRQRGFREIHFWSDTRFRRAHRFFEKFGFRADGRTREMHDGHEPYWERFYSLKLD